jgi:para-aminobenzoate synthetase/4-amino-4-deoxychorismate lyase
MAAAFSDAMSGEILLHHAATGKWWHFSDPIEAIEAYRVEEVLPRLRQVEAAVEKHNLYGVGFISYEAAPAFDPAFRVRRASDFPLLWFGLYREPAVDSALRASRSRQLEISACEWKPSVSESEYARAIARIKDEIARGNTYQANYTWRLRARFRADPKALFVALVEAQPVAYAAYLDTGQYALCSVSPELFFSRDGAMVVAKPMKGTAPRGRFNAEDRAYAAQLQRSAKNRAENVMIVDMVRNDLGRVAKSGSVRVDRLWETERYATIWQMTSTVVAETNVATSDLIAALFPCASITGAPKVNTMRILSELETEPRRVYTGGIGFLAPQRRAQFNVAIRTVLVDRKSGEAEYGVGGGITWDSEVADEYAECFNKARALLQPDPEFELFETMRWTRREGYFLLERHLARLRDSADYFDFAFDEERVRKALHELARSLTTPQRIRLSLARTGEVKLESAPLSFDDRQPLRLQLAPTPVNSRDRFLFHKTTHRSVYAAARALCRRADDVLLWNERGELTETTIGNVILRLNDELVTPPIGCGLLPGTMRAELLAKGRVRERIIMRDELERCTELYRINSVRGCERAVLITG